ncbi:glycosyltransferase family 21 protein [Pholiota conissans]|uniref:Ceramide glucosyltransferase n=1 Tax=Pholiota conissans TaxID=109636 RepID=A0A9P5Z5B1_9AGAR|nr:glycosyltransferase family 21 protein [Pholiota conissans]
MPSTYILAHMNRETLTFGVAVFGLVWYLAMWSLGLLGCLSARRRYRSRPVFSSSSSQNGYAPGVSILRPLKGLDTNLYENLESTFKQDYPNYEIIFSVADDKDQALNVVNALVARYPQVNVTVIIGEEVVGVNPKVNNLIRSFRKAAHDLLWVLDSGVMVDPGTLSRSVDIFTNTSSSSSKRIGLVHHVPFALIDEAKIGSRLEAAFLNTNHAKMYIAINTVSIDSCVVGKSNLYRRSDIERLNGSLIPIRAQVARRHEAQEYGLPAFGRFLAEDNMIASALWHELGLRHDLSSDVARNVVGNMTFSDYVWRRVRWIRVRKHMVLVATLLEPFTESVMLCLIGLLSVKYLLQMPSWIFVPLHFFLWLAVDFDVYASIGGPGLRLENITSFIIVWFARELLAFPIWLLAIIGNEIVWRGRRYQVLLNGEAKVCSD